MNNGGPTRLTTGGTAAWMLVQVNEGLADCARVIQSHRLHVVGGVNKEMSEAARVALSTETVVEIKETVAKLASLVEIVATVAEGLPRGGVNATYEEVARSAAHDLTEGVLNVNRVLWAAALLPADGGWQVLAQALAIADPADWWGQTRVADVLSTFRGAKPDAVRRALKEAEIKPEATFASCSSHDLVRLGQILGAAQFDD